MKQKFKVNSKSLLKQLSLANGVIVSNPVVPIIDNFLFEINANELNITSTDLLTIIKTKVDCESSIRSKITIPSKKLIDTIKVISDEDITISYDDLTYKIEIITRNGKYRMTGANATEYPKAIEVYDDNVIQIKSDKLKTLINSTTYAVSTDESKLNMNGVFMEIEDDSMTFVATDAFRVSKYKHNGIVNNNGSRCGIIIPKKMLDIFEGAIPNDIEDVTIKYNTNYISFSIKDTVVLSRIIDENFVPYNSVIHNNNDNTLIVSSNNLTNALKRVTLYGNKITNHIKFKVGGEGIVISAEDMDFETDAEELVPCQYEGSNISIGLNAKHLFDMLKNTVGDNLKINFTEFNKPVRIEPEVQLEGSEHIIVIVPVLLNR